MRDSGRPRVLNTFRVVSVGHIRIHMSISGARWLIMPSIPVVLPLPEPPMNANLRAIFPFFSLLIDVGSKALMLRELGMSLSPFSGLKKITANAALRQPPCELLFVSSAIENVIAANGGVIPGAKVFNRFLILDAASQVDTLLHPRNERLQVGSRRSVPSTLGVVPSLAGR